jgi:predicted Ser/Thr protein kinase
LQLGQKVGICPKLYFWGDRFIVMEYFNAPSLYEYLQQTPLTKELTKKILDLLDAFKVAGYNRFDHPGRHIFVLPGETFRIIDVVSIIKEKPVYLVDKLLRDMGKYAEDFLQYAKEIGPDWYNIWVKHPDFAAVMERVRREV